MSTNDAQRIATLEEARLARFLGDVSLGMTRVSGGVVARGEVDTTFNFAANLGMKEPITADDFKKMISWFERAGHEARVVACPYADPSLFEHLGQQGFAVERCEQVYYRSMILRSGHTFPMPRRYPRSINLSVIDATNLETVRKVAMVMAKGYARPDGPEAAGASGVVWEEQLACLERCMRHPRTKTVAAYIASTREYVGASMVDVTGDVAALIGTSVLEEHRRRGIHQALIAMRLTVAAQMGALRSTLACTSGSVAERNAQRYEYAVAYTRFVMRKLYQPLKAGETRVKRTFAAAVPKLKKHPSLKPAARKRLVNASRDPLAPLVFPGIQPGTNAPVRGGPTQPPNSGGVNGDGTHGGPNGGGQTGPGTWRPRLTE